jgi:ABC-2 type transport system ATP-binding protein
MDLDIRKRADEIRTHSGALLEFSGLYERMSAEDNLDLYGRIYKVPAAERHTRTRELLEHLDLWERRKDRVGTWSRGMKQKLAVARALFHRPPLVFLDEPTAGFDPVAAAALRKDLAGLVAHEGVTVFLNTHNLTEAEQLCAQVGVIRAGKLLTLGSPDSLRMRDRSPRVKITGRGFDERMAALLRQRPEVAQVDLLPDRLEIELLDEKSRNAPLVSLIVQNGGEVEEISRGGASLEEVFLTLVREENP